MSLTNHGTSKLQRLRASYFTWGNGALKRWSYFLHSHSKAKADLRVGPHSSFLATSKSFKTVTHSVPYWLCASSQAPWISNRKRMSNDKKYWWHLVSGYLRDHSKLNLWSWVCTGEYNEKREGYVGIKNRFSWWAWNVRWLRREIRTWWRIVKIW